MARRAIVGGGSSPRSAARLLQQRGFKTLSMGAWNEPRTSSMLLADSEELLDPLHPHALA